MSSQLLKLQSRLIEKIDENREYFGISGHRNDNFCFGEDLIESEMELDLSAGNKVLFLTSPHVIETVQDTCVLEVDDIEDADIVNSLFDNPPDPGFEVRVIRLRAEG